MTGRVVGRRTAEQVIDAAVCIADEGSFAAARFMDALDETVRAVPRMPGAGRPRELANPALAGTRSRLVTDFESCLVSYAPTDVGFEVVRALHGARDIDAIFQEDGQAT